MPTLHLECAHATDHVVAAALAKRCALDLGFDEAGANAVAIAVGELVSNAVRHAGAGTLELQETLAPRPGLQITVSDRGPGISASKQAALVGLSKAALHAEYSTMPQELSHGLGAVMRLLECTQITSTARGTTITAFCYIKHS